MPRLTLHAQVVEALREIASMIELVERAVVQVTDAVVASDVALAETVISQDDVIDAAYTGLEQRIHEMFARQAPVAGDLRALMAIVRIIGDVERAGDLALNIAKAVVRMAPYHLAPPLGTVVEGMGSQAVALLEGAAWAVRDLEPDTAERLDLVDDVMDELCRSLISRLAGGADDVGLALAMDLALVTRHYERIGDHAVSVAERVEFLVTGRAHGAHVGL